MTSDEVNSKIAMLMCEIDDLRTQIDEVAAQAAGAVANAIPQGLGRDHRPRSFEMYWDPSYPVPERPGVPAHKGAWVMCLQRGCCMIGKDWCQIMNPILDNRMELEAPGDWFGHAIRSGTWCKLQVDQQEAYDPQTGEEVWDFWIGNLDFQNGPIKQIAYGTVVFGGDGDATNCDDVSTNLTDEEGNEDKIQLLDFEDGNNIPDTDFVSEILKPYGNYYDVVVRDHGNPKTIKYLKIGENLNLDGHVPRVFEPEFGPNPNGEGVVIANIGDGAWQYARYVSKTFIVDRIEFPVGHGRSGEIFLCVSHYAYPPTAKVCEETITPESTRYRTNIPLYKFRDGAIILDYRGFPHVQLYE